MLRRSIRFSVGVGSLFDLACLNKALAETAADFGGNVGAITGVRRKPSHQVDNGDEYGENDSFGSSGRQVDEIDVLKTYWHVDISKFFALLTFSLPAIYNSL
uniref:Uncharacterized protein n=1 Tax=Meloidogyne javanica TaxID=6303 RepID=A0A915LFZ4_MELJA